MVPIIPTSQYRSTIWPSLYQSEGRNADALPIVERMIGSGRAQPRVALPVLFAAQRDQAMAPEKALDDALNVVQHGAQSSAASAVNKLAVRLPPAATGSRNWCAAIRISPPRPTRWTSRSLPPSPETGRNATRRRRAAAATGWSPLPPSARTLQKTFAAEFPDYAALSNPLPMTAREVQALLSGDEALLLFSVADKESYVFALTRERFDWQPLPLGAEALSQKVAAFRRGLDVGKARDASGKSGLFDLALANELYATLLGPVETLVKDKRSLLVAPSGALTALPFHLLVTERPPAAIPETFAGYRDAAWLIKRQAVSVLPSVASLKALRAFARNDHATKPMTGFGDPLFNPMQDSSGDNRAAAATKSASRSLVTSAYTEFWQGAGVDRARLAQALPQLPDTADELKGVASDLGVAASDIHLGADASETTVKRARLSDYGIVYFATHGLVAGDVKGLAEPSLALSIPKQPSELDDGLLTSSEVAQLKLNADWVVLVRLQYHCRRQAGRGGLVGPGALVLLRWRPRIAGLALGGGFGSRDPARHRDLRPYQGRSEDRPRQAAASDVADLNDASSPKNAYPAFWGPFALIGEGAAPDPR